MTVVKQAIFQIDINAVLRMIIVMLAARKGMHIAPVCKSAPRGKCSSTQVRKKPCRQKLKRDISKREIMTHGFKTEDQVCLAQPHQTKLEEIVCCMHSSVGVSAYVDATA